MFINFESSKRWCCEVAALERHHLVLALGGAVGDL